VGSSGSGVVGSGGSGVVGGCGAATGGAVTGGARELTNDLIRITEVDVGGAVVNDEDEAALKPLAFVRICRPV
jgi:hypothetical protein